MFWTLIATIFAGFAGAGVGLLLRRVTRQRLPRSIVPILAGGVMLAATVGQEYGWYTNVLDTMDQNTIVIWEREHQAWWQPWTYVGPWVRGFAAYVPSETVETAPGSGVLVAQIWIQERWNPATIRPILVHCALGRRADILPDTVFGAGGDPVNANWQNIPPTDPILASFCNEEG